MLYQEWFSSVISLCGYSVLWKIVFFYNVCAHHFGALRNFFHLSVSVCFWCYESGFFQLFVHVLFMLPDMVPLSFYVARISSFQLFMLLEMIPFSFYVARNGSFQLSVSMYFLHCQKRLPHVKIYLWIILIIHMGQFHRCSNLNNNLWQ